MKDLQLLMMGAMVRATLDGTKTQTRRCRGLESINKRPDDCAVAYQDGAGGWVFWADDAPETAAFTKRMYPNGGGFRCPYGAPGDRLWVRETWAASLDSDGDMCKPFLYRATYDEAVYGPLKASFSDRATEIWDGIGNTGWRPSIHMPRWASRLTLEVTGVRVERVQDISEVDAGAEGIECGGEWEYDTARNAFRDLWDSINGARGYGWDANPWVWVVEFKRVFEETQ
jgi:hypothetical protein